MKNAYGGDTVPDYKAMYYRMFNAMTDISKYIQIVQQDCEEMYIRSKYESNLSVVNDDDEERD